MTAQQLKQRRAELAAEYQVLQNAAVEAKRDNDPAKREALTRQLLEAQAELTTIKVLQVQAVTREREALQPENLPTTQQALRAAKKAFGDLMGFVGDAGALLDEWREEPPASVADCIAQLAEVLGEGS
jgi:hypothetical protein